jgi:hypothetical protein
MKSALQQAYVINDEYLIANTSWWYGETMYYCKAIELATMYCLNAVEILDKKGITGESHKYHFSESFFMLHVTMTKVSITFAGLLKMKKTLPMMQE